MNIKRKNKFIIFGVFLTLIGLIIGITPFFLQKDKDIKDEEKVNDYINNTSIKENVNGNIYNRNNNNEEYLMVLEIPKLGFKRGVYSINSSLNTIEKNIEIMKESTMPTEVSSNVVLEGHNGTSNISYFRELDKLNINDYAYIYYQGVKYKYKVSNIYDVLKDGDVEVYRDINRNTLTLITCKSDTDDKQLVIICYLDKEESY